MIAWSCQSFILDVWELRKVRLYVCEVRQTPHVHILYVRLLTVPPSALGAWSMALVLWQPPDRLSLNEKLGGNRYIKEKHI